MYFSERQRFVQLCDSPAQFAKGIQEVEGLSHFSGKQATWGLCLELPWSHRGNFHSSLEVFGAGNYGVFSKADGGGAETDLQLSFDRRCLIDAGVAYRGGVVFIRLDVLASFLLVKEWVIKTVITVLGKWKLRDEMCLKGH